MYAIRSYYEEYRGTLLLVSHDRAFLDNVVTQTLAAEGGGRWREYVGGYSDWLAQRPAPVAPGRAAAPRPQESRAAASKPARAKLSYKEGRELEQLPAQLEALENEQQAIAAKMAAADYHASGADGIRADLV